MQTRTDLNWSVLEEMRSRNFGFESPTTGRLKPLGGGRAPNMIVPERGSQNKPKSPLAAEPEKDKDSVKQRPSSENLSGSVSRSNSGKDNKDISKIVNGDLKKSPAQTNGDASLPSDVPRSRSSSPPRSPTLVATLSRSGSSSRDAKLVSRSSSVSSTRSSRKSVGRAAGSSPPPLIPPPKTFLERKASSTSSTSSRASSKRSNQDPLPPPPSPPPHTTLTTQDSDTFPPPPDSEDHAQSHPPSRSESNKSTKTSRAPQPPPPPSPPLPPPPPSSLDIFPDSQQPVTSHGHAEPVASPNLLTPTSDLGMGRKNSTSPSEVMGMLDEAIGKYNNSSSSYTGTHMSEPFTPLSHESFSETFNPVKENAAEASELTLDLNEDVFPETAQETSAQHSGRFETEPTSKEPISHDDSPRSTDSGQPKGDSSEDSSDNNLRIELSELSPTSKKQRKGSRNSKNVAVSKLVPDIKTVRQQIKPGTVDELATLFTNMREEQVSSPPKDTETFDYDFEETVGKFDKILEQSEEPIRRRPSSNRRFGVVSEDLSTRLEAVASNEDLPFHRKLEHSQSVDALGTQPSPRLFATGSETNLEIPDPKTTPGFDYLSASREIFKHVISSRQNSFRRGYSEEPSIDSVIASPSSTMATSEKDHEETVSSATMLTSHEDDSEHTKIEETQANVNMTDVHGLNTGDIMEQSKHALHTDSTGERNSDAFLTSSVDHENSGPIFSVTANIPLDKSPQDTFSQLYSGEADLNRGDDEDTIENNNGDLERGEFTAPETLHPTSHVADGAEPPFLTSDEVEENEDYTNINKEHRFINHVSVNDNSSSAASTGLQLSQTGFERDEMSLVSVRSEFGSDLETIAKLRQDRELWESGSERSTSSSRPGSLKQWTHADTTSKDDVTVIDDGSKAQPIPGSDHELASEIDLTTHDQSEVVEEEISATGETTLDVESAVVFDKEDSSSSSSSSSDSEEEGATNEGTQPGGHEMFDKTQDEGSPSTYVVNVTGQGEDANVQKQTGEEFGDGLFAHPHLTLVSDDTADPGAGDRMEERQDEELRNVNYTEQESVGFSSRKSSTSSEEGSREERDPISEAFKEKEQDGGQTEITTSNQSDDFFSILDDIQLETDITSNFVGKNILTPTHSSEKQDSSDIRSDPKDDFMNTQEEYTVEAVRRDSVREGDAVDGTEGADNEEEFHLGLDLNDEIRKQHEILSPKLSDSVFDETTLNFSHNETVSTRGSVSSSHSSRKGDHSSTAKKTVFNSEFFSNSELTKETRKESSSSDDSTSDGASSRGDRKDSRAENTREKQDYNTAISQHDFLIVNKSSAVAEYGEEDSESIKQTYGSHTLSSPRTPQSHPTVEQEDQRTTELEDDSYLFSKERFKALRDVFAKGRQEENSIEQVTSFQTNNRGSFKFATGPSSPAEGFSGSKYAEKQENGGQVSGGGFSSPVRLETRSTRDDVDSEYLPPKGDIGIESALQRENGERTDTSSSSASGSDGETRTRRLKKKKSKQQRYSDDLQSGEADRDLSSQKSSVKSSSSKGSVKRTEVSDVFAPTENAPETSSVKLWNHSSRLSSDSDLAQRKLRSWETNESLNVLQRGRAKSSSSESDRSSTKVKDISRQTSSVKSNRSSVKSNSPRGSLGQAAASNAFSRLESKSDSSDSENSQSKLNGNISLKAHSVKSTSSRGSVSETASNNFFFDADKSFSPSYRSSALVQSDIVRQDSHVASEKGSVRSRSSKGSVKQASEKRSSSSESDRSSVKARDSFRKSGSVKSDKGSVKSDKSSVKSDKSSVKSDKSSATSKSSKGSVIYRGQNGVHVDKDHASSSSDSDASSTKLKGDISRQTSSVKSAGESRASDKMTAVVGEVSSFGIHKLTSHEESFSVTSDNSSLPVSPRNSIAAHQEQNGSDIYLIQDNKGDYYALQEVNDSENHGGVQNNVTAHVMNTSTSEGNYGKFNGHASLDTAFPSNSYNNASKETRSNLYVDSSAVEEDKAREVISAFLDSQEASHRQRQTNSAHTEDSFKQSTTINQHHSSDYDSVGSGRGHWGPTHTHAGDNVITVNNSGGHDYASTSQNRSSVVVQQQGFNGVTNDTSFHSDGYLSPASHNSFTAHRNNDLLRNSSVAVHSEVNTRTDNSQTWSVPGYEPYTTGGGAEDRHSGSLVITNVIRPQGNVYDSQTNTPRVDTTYYDTQGSRGYLPTSSSSAFQPLSVNVNHNQDQQGISPFKTNPITITTTTQAVVGEKVDMHISLSPTEGSQYQPTTDTLTSSSEDESQDKRYVVRSVPKKSSLKKTSKYDSSSFNDSSSDIVYTKKETVTADVNLGGKNREIILRPYEYDNRQTRRPVSVSDSLSPDSVDGNLYRVYQSPRAHSSRSLSPVTSSRRDDRDYYSKNVYETSSSFSRDAEDGNLYRVRNLSTSVPDGLHQVSDRRGRWKTKSPHSVDSEKSYRIVHSGRKQHHSPERFFKNPKLSLRRDDYETRGYSSDEDTGQQQYRTVTKVYLNGDKPRSRSQSPTTRYKVSSPQTHSSFEEKSSTTRHYKVSSPQTQSSFDQKDFETSKDDRLYKVKTKRHGSPGSSGSESDSGHKTRYRVKGTSDSSSGVRAHSSPKLGKKQKSFEEATITRTETVKPSKVSTPSTKTHTTVIQLEVGDNRIKEINKKSEDKVDSPYVVRRVQSVDDIFRDSNKTTKITVNRQHSSDAPKMYRTGRARSAERGRRHSSSDDADSDIERTGVYDMAPRLVKTLKQKDGNKMYVVNSTVGDPAAKDGNIIHPPGWYTSTIDINEDYPDRARANNTFVSTYTPPNDNFNHSRAVSEERADTQNYRSEKTVYFVRERSPPANVGKYSYSPDSGQGTEVASSDGETENIRQKFERVERIYEVRTEPQIPEHLESVEDLSNDLRVLRGKILIKNRLDSEHDEDDFDENANLFDSSFHLGKDNPLYSSDPDILASLQREEEQEISKHVHQDITFEHVDRIAHKYQGDRHAQLTPRPQRKQNLSTLLLSKLASVDSKDIRQTIDVEHHNEEIYGDIDFIHADGERTTSKHTSNFDSVNEKVELTLTQGKAYVIIKVIAERIVPIDYEFNVWRKSQAIVTRNIEIDLLANEQRRRLYEHVMESAGTSGALEDGRPKRRSHYYDTEQLSPQEKQLSSMETLKLFSQILDVADGQGDKDHTETHTKQEMGQLPSSASDLLY